VSPFEDLCVTGELDYIHLFIYLSLNKYLLNTYYVAGTTQGKDKI
jgi:hypothetical protein